MKYTIYNIHTEDNRPSSLSLKWVRLSLESPPYRFGDMNLSLNKALVKDIPHMTLNTQSYILIISQRHTAPAIAIMSTFSKSTLNKLYNSIKNNAPIFDIKVKPQSISKILLEYRMNKLVESGELLEYGCFIYIRNFVRLLITLKIRQEKIKIKQELTKIKQRSLFQSTEYYDKALVLLACLTAFSALTLHDSLERVISKELEDGSSIRIITDSKRSDRISIKHKEKYFR
ncbi:hypothetical protein H8356DRAFT_1415838 [Neocallimastix lanati (nom. inval.)]|nr:hypothetical protein H8356DRAFT_1415838 [Neocallimastix sp. JGI-2020a]